MTNKLINMQAFMVAAEWDAKIRLWSISDAQLNRLPTIDPIHAAGGCYCRECKHRETVLCPMSEVYEYPWKDTRDNDFCSYGELIGGEDDA